MNTRQSPGCGFSVHAAGLSGEIYMWTKQTCIYKKAQTSNIIIPKKLMINDRGGAKEDIVLSNKTTPLKILH